MSKLRSILKILSRFFCFFLFYSFSSEFSSSLARFSSKSSISLETGLANNYADPSRTSFPGTLLSPSSILSSSLSPSPSLFASSRLSFIRIPR